MVKDFFRDNTDCCVADAEAIRASVVVEGSNFGPTPEARARLHERGIPVIPDVVASSSSAAMVTRQMAAGSSLSQEELWAAIETSIDQATRSTLRLAGDRGLEPRDAYLSWLQGP